MMLPLCFLCAACGPEATEMDCGTFSYAAEEGSTDYADSAMYDGLSYRVLDFDHDILIRDDYAFYRI